MQTRRADAAGVECIPLVSARANPKIAIAGRPFAQWTADLRTRYASEFLTANFCFNWCLNSWKIEDLGAGFVRAHSPILLWITGAAATSRSIHSVTRDFFGPCLSVTVT